MVSAKDSNVKRFVYSSSSSVYGNPASLPTNESSPINPLSPYGMQKYYGELACNVFAKILSIDCSKALELPGVVAIATGIDAKNKFGVLPVTKDEHAMAGDKVRHAGDLVACVAAEDEATAREAERLIEVEYEILDSIHAFISPLIEEYLKQ